MDVVYTERAKRDIDKALDYIEFELCNATAAENLVEKLEKTERMIRKYPEMYPIFVGNIRHTTVKNYKLFYYVDGKLGKLGKHCQRIIIIRFLPGRSDWQNTIKSSW